MMACCASKPQKKDSRRPVEEGVPAPAITAAGGWAVVHPLSGPSPLQAALLRLTFAKAAAHERLGRDSACDVAALGVDVTAAVGLLVMGVEPPPQTFEKGATDADVQEFIAQMGAAAAAVRAVVFTIENKITDGGLRQLVATCTQLTTLNLGGCEAVTDEGVRAVAATCTQLTTLNLYCSAVTDEMKIELRAKGVEVYD